MKGIKLANIVMLVTGLGLTALGISLIMYHGAKGGRDSDTPPVHGELPATVEEWLAEGDKLVLKHNCNFCHRTEVPQDATHIPRDNCQSCHQYKSRPENLAPPLDSIAERRTEPWIKRYLRYPYPIRQNSNDRMPDLGLTDREVTVLTKYLALKANDAISSLPDWKPKREAEPSEERLQKGTVLWLEYNCRQCHTLGDDEIKPTYDNNGRPHLMPVVFAPDLSRAWTRVRPEWLAEGIRHPAQRMPWSGMLQTNMTEEEARELAWYVTNAVPSPRPTVSASEVMDVLRRRCNGCHYAPDKNAPASANPEGGAGWLDTWSAKPRKLDLWTLEGVMRGAVDDLGEPRPSVIPYDENSPLLMHIKGLKHPRMPFGMNPLPPEETELIERWILSGAPLPADKGGIKVNPPIEMGD
ncbi:MAG: c-type cytochrome [Planctomycetes bacterium]|nr:c-type cytochrome [Planctomycetota bacterium]